MDINRLKAQEWNVTNVKLNHSPSHTDADPCHFKVESAKYDKWAFNGSGVTVVWKGRSISSSSSTELLCVSPACEFFIIYHLNTKALAVFYSFSPHMQTCCVTHFELTRAASCTSVPKLRWKQWRQLAHLRRSRDACVDLLFLVCVALPWVEQIKKKWNEFNISNSLTLP